MCASRSGEGFALPPDPGSAGTLDELVERLRLLKVWAGGPSFDTITDRINTAWRTAGRPASELARRTTVVDCFRNGRRRLNTDLVVAVVAAMHPDAGYVTLWRQALRVVAGETEAAAQVRVQDRLPPDLAGFTGRSAELDRLRQALRRGGQDGGAVVISGMAGVGKTKLAVHTAHGLAGEKLFDRVLFVNLRGFHPDAAQPPADPAAVLEGFLRLLGMPGQQIPHDLPGRAEAYRGLLAGTRTLVLLDNAADADQVGPLLAATRGCPVLVTSRHSLTALHSAAHLELDVFTSGEALRFLTGIAPGVPTGADPHAAARIAGRCGHLPLALGLVAAHIRETAGWTLTDHADRLDERHDSHHLDTGVQLALDVSYRQLPAGQRRLLRMAALHPGQDLDAYAAAALTGTDLRTARTHLDRLYRDHLVQQASASRYALHDLVRAHAAGRAGDEDPPPARRAALTRLFDYYLAAAAGAMDTVHPGETHRRPHIPPPGTPVPALDGVDAARAWLDTERPTLVAVASYTAAHGWPTHAIQLSSTLFRYLAGGYHSDSLAIHAHAHQAAHHTGDQTARAHALVNLGVTHSRLGQHERAVDHLRQALHLFRQAGDPVDLARAHGNLGIVAEAMGRYRRAAGHYEQALALFRQAQDLAGMARALTNFGIVERRLGRCHPAAEHHEQALALFRQIGDQAGVALALSDIGEVEVRLGRYEQAADHLHQALALFQQIGDQASEANVLDGLGTLHVHLGQPVQAGRHYLRALAIVREIGERPHEAWVLNGLGEAARSGGRPGDALAHHAAALTVATDIGDLDQQARAHTGLAHAHHVLGDLAPTQAHYQLALALYTDLGTPEADHLKALLTVFDDQPPNRGAGDRATSGATLNAT